MTSNERPALILRRQAETSLKDAVRFEQSAAESAQLAETSRQTALECLRAAEILEKAT